jgi:hypothetical protein
LSEVKRTITQAPERKANAVREGHRTSGFPVFGLALGGLVLGHLATYAWVYPDPDHRGLVLSSTGHAYLPVFAHLACVLAAAAAAAVVGRAWGGRERGTAATFAGLAGALAVTQACAFVGQEILERVLSGSSLHDLISGPLLVLGVGAQVTLAVGGAAIATWLRRTTRLAAAAPSATRVRMWRPRALVFLVVSGLGPAALAFVGVRPGRSPPSV